MGGIKKIDGINIAKKSMELKIWKRVVKKNCGKNLEKN
jgi:hypothetical protein